MMQCNRSAGCDVSEAWRGKRYILTRTGRPRMIGQRVDPRKYSTTGLQAQQNVPITFFFSREADGKKISWAVTRLLPRKSIAHSSCHTHLLTLHAARTTRARPGEGGSEVWDRKDAPSPIQYLQIAAGHKSPAQIAPSQGNETSIARIAEFGEAEQKQGEAVEEVWLLFGINKVNMPPSMWSMRWSHQVIRSNVVHHHHRRHQHPTASSCVDINSFIKKIVHRRTRGPCTTNLAISSTALSAPPPITSS